MNKEKVSVKEAIKFCVFWALKYPWMMLFMLLPGLLTPLDQSIPPIMIKKIINIATFYKGNEMLDKILGPCLIYAFCIIVWELVWRLYSYFVNVKYVPKIRKAMTMYCMDKLLEKSHRFFKDEMSGELSKKLMDLIDAPIQMLYFVANRVPLRIATVLGGIVVLWMDQAIFAVIVLVWAVIFVIIFMLFFPKIANRSEDFSEEVSKINGEFTDVFINVASVRLFANKNLEYKILDIATNSAMQKERKMEKSFLYLFLYASFSFVIVQSISLYVLVKMKFNEAITAGDFALVLAINYNIVESMWYSMFEVTDFTRYLGKVQQALKDLYAKIEVVDIPNAKELEARKGEIEFQNVSFTYGKSYKPSFQNFSCKIKSGEKVGLVGESGAGKTSFISILLRLYDIQKGKILIDNQDIKSITQYSLHKNISVIPQDPSLFNRSIYDNILYGKSESHREEVYKSASLAYAHDFILSKDEGYNTLVGERGEKLSGGQRQRVAIARAFLKDAPILILDEATSALDSSTEKEIQKSLCFLMQGKTCIVIAHRLSTLVNMDRILVFEKGRIVQDGPHSELIKLEGIYKKLWETQSNIAK